MKLLGGLSKDKPGKKRGAAIINDTPYVDGESDDSVSDGAREEL